MTPSSDPKPVQLWYTRCGSATASALAIRKNWLQEAFATADTELLSLRESNNLDVRNSHFNHSQSGMFREGGNIPPIWARSNGQENVVIGITWLDEYQGVLVRADSDLHSPADLKGRRLGIPLHRDALIDFQRGAAQHGFATALAQAGLTPADAEFVDIEIPPQERASDSQGVNPPQDHPTLRALERGDIDAVFIRYARGYRVAQDSRFRQVLNIFDLPEPLQRINNGTPRPITVDRAFLEQHPQLVVRYLTVLLRTAQWAQTHRTEVAELLLPESGGETLADVFAAHGDDVHLSFTPKLTPAYISGLEAQKNFLRDWGYLKQDFDIQQWIVHGPLQEAQRILAAEQASARSAEPVPA